MQIQRYWSLVLVIALTFFPVISWAQSTGIDTSRGDRLVTAYLRSETERLASASHTAAASADLWKSGREELRRQLFDMYCLDPLPPRGDLKAVVTGSVERDGVVVEKLHFQSIPGLYVTANLYRPKEVTKPLPTILYLCGHGQVKKGGVSFGNKCTYTHHGSWFAKNGYICLTIDTLQLGEIEGIHHGTRRFDRWWWMCRGYTPAGVEAWNNIRALDYLETRPEVDRDRIGATGRSGGGAYSWSLMGLDDRIKVAVPVAGIVDLESYVVDGAITGHCDCMFFNNTYERDYTQLAGIAAPRPVLLSNTDKDHIFPLDGVLRIHDFMHRVYGFSNSTDKLGLQISEGPHKDIPELQVAAFRWLNRFLKNEDPPIEPAAKLFTPEELKVFDRLPSDQINTRADEVFVPLAENPKVPESVADWNTQRDRWLKELRQKTFRAWPADDDLSRLPPLNAKELTTARADGLRLRTFEFTSQSNVPLSLWIADDENVKAPSAVTLDVLDSTNWPKLVAGLKAAFPKEFEASPADKKNAASTTSIAQARKRLANGPIAFFAPRGVGPTAWSSKGRNDVEIRRRFLLLGQTLDGMQAFDIRRACQALRSIEGLRELPLHLDAQGQMAGNALYASLFEPNIERLDLYLLPPSHRQGPYYLNVLRVLDLPQALAMAIERSQVHVHTESSASPSAGGSETWAYAQEIQKLLGQSSKGLSIHSTAKSR